MEANGVEEKKKPDKKGVDIDAVAAAHEMINNDIPQPGGWNQQFNIPPNMVADMEREAARARPVDPEEPGQVDLEEARREAAEERLRRRVEREQNNPRPAVRRARERLRRVRRVIEDV